MEGCSRKIPRRWRLREALRSFNHTSLKEYQFHVVYNGKSPETSETLRDIEQFRDQIVALDLLAVKRTDQQRIFQCQFKRLKNLNMKDLVVFFCPTYVNIPQAVLQEVSIVNCKMSPRHLNELFKIAESLRLENVSSTNPRMNEDDEDFEDSYNQDEEYFEDSYNLKRLSVIECSILRSTTSLLFGDFVSLHTITLDGEYGTIDVSSAVELYIFGDASDYTCIGKLDNVKRLTMPQLTSFDLRYPAQPNLEYLKICFPVDPALKDLVSDKCKSVKRVEISYWEPPHDDTNVILTLNNDCMFLIMDNLSERDRLMFGASHLDIGETYKLYNRGKDVNFTLKKGSQKYSESDLQLLGPFVHILQVWGFCEVEFYRLIVHFPHVKCIDVFGVWFEKSNLIHKFPDTLEEVHFRFPLPTSFLAAFCARYSKNLRKLTLGMIHEPVKAIRLPKMLKLTHLNIYARDIIRIFIFLKTFPNLSEIKLMGPTMIYKLSSLIKCLPRHLKKIEGSVFQMLRPILERCQNLDTIVTSCDYLELNLANISFLSSLPKLKRLKISKIYVCDGLIELIDNIPSLEELEIDSDVYHWEKFGELIAHLQDQKRKIKINDIQFGGDIEYLL